jgi:uncharacterized membrane protein
MIVGFAIAVAMAVLSVAAAPSLPEQMTTNWNAAGSPDDTMSKQLVLLGGPALVAGVVVLFEAIPRLDPLAENFSSFQRAYDVTAVLIAGFLAYVYGYVIAWNLGYQVAIERALAPAFVVLYVGIGFLLERAERNWFVGIRTPWTLSSETVWRRTHDLGATLFKLCSVVALGGLLAPSYFVYFVAGPVAVVAVVTTVYSFVLYRRVDSGSEPDEIERTN